VISPNLDSHPCRYFDGHLTTSRGQPLTIQNAICMHEEDHGVSWKHTDRRLPHTPEVRRSRRLVISSMCTVENYEYGFFWCVRHPSSLLHPCHGALNWELKSRRGRGWEMEDSRRQRTPLCLVVPCRAVVASADWAWSVHTPSRAPHHGVRQLH
jgi:hypothetical protein